MSEENNTNVEYLYRITYKEYVQLMRKWIIKSREMALFYLNMLSICNQIINVNDENIKKIIDDYVCSYYKERFLSSLDALLTNMDTLKVVSMMREDYVFFVDNYGVPYAVFVPKEIRKRLEREDKYVT